MKSEPQRVFFIPKWYPNPEDPQLGVFLREQAEILSEELQVVIIHAHSAPGLKEKYQLEKREERGFPEYQAFYRPAYRGSLSSPFRAFRYFNALWKAWKAAIREEGKPELLHVHILNRPGLFAYLISLRYGIRFIISEQWSGFLDGRAQKRPFSVRFLTRFLLRRASGVTAVSKGLAKELQKAGARRFPEIIPNATKDPGTPRPIPKDPVRFLNVSDMVDEIKNISGVVRAFEMLVRDGWKGIELHLVGGGPDENKIREMVQERGLSDYVSFYGRLENQEVHERFPEMSVAIVNSLHETFSVVTIEALAHGRPVLASRCGGPEGILEGSGCGTLFPKGKDEATKAAMKEHLERIHEFDPQELHRYAMEHFGRETVKEKLLAFYRKSLSRE